MSGYDSLVGQRFHRDGVEYTIVDCRGDAVLAFARQGSEVEEARFPLHEVLDVLEVTEMTVTELPGAEEA